MKKTINIEKLDDGFIVTQNNKRKAIQTEGQLKDNLAEFYAAIFEEIRKPLTRESIIEIETTVNPPKLSNQS